MKRFSCYSLVAMFVIVLFCVLSNLRTSSQHAPVNVALGKEMTHCSGSTYNLTDGLFNFITIVCRREIYLRIDLVESYHIYYVILYSGAGAGDNTFDYYKVTLRKGSVMETCGTYHAKLSLTSPLNGYRVNCKKSRDRFNTVIFNTDDSEIYSTNVSEVAIYTFSRLENPEEQFFYLGCYTESHGIGQFPFYNIIDCSQRCWEKYLYFMAINQNVHECHCGTKTRGNRTTKNTGPPCNVTCTDSTYKCGGRSVYSVYMIDIKLPTVERCTDERHVHDEISRFRIISETGISKCIRHCSGYLHAFISERQCSCVNQSLINVRNKQCDFACSSNANKACGPGYVFFSTCEHSDFSYMNCDDLFKCFSDYDMFLGCNSCIDSGLDEQYALPFCIGLEHLVPSTIRTPPWFFPTVPTLPANLTTRSFTSSPPDPSAPEPAASGPAAPGTAAPRPATPGSAAPGLSTASRATNVNGDKESTSKPDTENGTLGKGDSVVFVGVVITSLFIAYFSISMID